MHQAGPRIVTTEPLTREAFAPFGQVLTAGTGAGRETNLGTAVRFDRSADLESARPGATPNLAVFRAMPQTLPFDVTVMERHPYSTQAFVPMRASRWLVCVAPALEGGEPDMARLRAFLVGSDQGINYRVGVWHHPMIVFDAPAEMIMLAWEDGTADDCLTATLPEPVRVVDR